MAYQQYIASHKAEQYRYCHFRAGSSIDFEKLVEFKASREQEGDIVVRKIKVQRADETNRFLLSRPNGDRFVSAEQFVFRDNAGKCASPTQK